MDKKYYIWLQIIQGRENKFNYKTLQQILKKLKVDIVNLYNLEFNIVEIKKITNIPKSIIYAILDKNIKDEVKSVMKKIRQKKLYIVTVEDRMYPKRIMEKFITYPFCFLVNKVVNFNKKNVYLYYDKYFTNYGKRVLKYFYKIIDEHKGNIYTKYDLKNVIEFVDIDEYEIKDKKCIIVLDKGHKESLFYQIIDIVIIIEANYEPEIVNIVDNFLSLNKDIYSVPSNIFGNNCYFSNYLIKQGADIILNKRDLKFILSNII